jgi:hypothetical protein
MLKNYMFWKKLTYRDDEIGEFTFSGGCWIARAKIISQDKIFVNVVGDKAGPNSESLKQAKDLLSSIIYYVEEAKKYIETIDNTEFTEGHGSFIFDGFYSTDEIGLFDLDFGLSKWDDASITVHFKNNKPFEISLGD